MHRSEEGVPINGIHFLAVTEYMYVLVALYSEHKLPASSQITYINACCTFFVHVQTGRHTRADKCMSHSRQKLSPMVLIRGLYSIYNPIP